MKDLAIKILKEKDPKLDLPKENRFAAEIYNKRLIYSQNIREGISESLALIGSKPQALSSCSNGKAKAIVDDVIRSLLKDAIWEQWASLESHLPLLAEGSPDQFLEAVESALINLSESPFNDIFDQELSTGFGGHNYMTGLLWALESLAWHPDNLSRVSIILADIASIDPGGNWANRAANSLKDIFLPWHIQTIATFDRRIASLKAVLIEQPKVGWELLIELIQSKNGFTTGSHQPIWRDYIPRNWSANVLVSEFRDQMIDLSKLALEDAKTDSEKLSQLVKILNEIPNSVKDSILNYLASDDVIELPEDERFTIWNELDKLVRKHKRFSDTDWAFPEEKINEINNIATCLSPKSLEFLFSPLFSEYDHDLYEEKGNYKEQETKLESKREEAIQKILASGGLDQCLNFTKKVTFPEKVGRSLGVIASGEIEDEILKLLESNDENEVKMASEFLWTKYWNLGTDWLDIVLEKDLNLSQYAKILTQLPFDEEVWDRVSSKLGDTHESLYWKNVKVNPRGNDRDLSFAVKKLIRYGREGEAVRCISRMSYNHNNFNVELAVSSLLALLESNDEVKYLDNYDTVELIKRIQYSKNVKQEDLFIIEWNFLPWFGQFSSGSAITLEKQLASDPDFFVKVVALAVHSKNNNVSLDPEKDKYQILLARNAYRLLYQWEYFPGIQNDGSFNSTEFKNWINEVSNIAEDSDLTKVIQSIIGRILTYAPIDPNGLWIHKEVAKVINNRNADIIRRSFITELYNKRGIYSFSHGKEEYKLLLHFKQKADELDINGFPRFATSMRSLADSYKRLAEIEEERKF